ncbi:bactericidal permeability-increasing protein-like isoform X2 [Clupea harengus]|uniref:Bactericidal permeability-increasing protein n=1 Tax=Clupea harengus TaxID=7950 RepID=A0A6P8F4N9_CLUHA|nr:bactericidal permeability-increasing protein-like isoform X2 [Clupea harengus]
MVTSGRMSPWCLLTLLTLVPLTLSSNAGVKVKLTQKGLEYARQIGMTTLQQKLKTIKVPDLSGTEKVAPIGKVKYTLSGMQITSLGLPKSQMGMVPGTGVSLAIGNAFLSLHGNWKVRYLHFIKDSGSFDLAVKDLTINTNIALKSDETGRPAVNTVSCTSNVGSASIKFHGGASAYIDKALRSALQKQICPLVSDAISELNPHLKTLNVLAPVDKYAEIEYSMVASPVVSKAFVDFGLKGEFYNIGRHKEPPFSPPVFGLPPQVNNMLYIGVSSFTANSASFVYNNAGAFNLFITDDMIPPSSPIRLNTRTFGAFIPQLAKEYPGLMMKLLVKTTRQPIISFQVNNVTLQASGTVTAYAIQPNTTLAPLFILNMETSVSAHIYVTGVKLAGSVILNRMSMSLGASYVGPFQVKSLDNIFLMVLKVAVLPKINAHLQKGYPLPAIGKMSLVNTQLQVLKDYMLIGTDVSFRG